MIVRELITKFGFDADFDKLQRWNRGIDQTKKKSDEAASAGRTSGDKIAAGADKAATGFTRLAQRASELRTKLIAAYNAQEHDRDSSGQLVKRKLDVWEKIGVSIKKGGGHLKEWGRDLAGLIAQMAKYAAIAGAVALGALGVAATRKAGEFESLQAGLTTAAGGDKVRGAEEFERVKQFAKETPFTLNEVTNAVLRLQNIGLDSSNAVLTSFGNIAASFPGKTILDFIEAVADATTFEFERLKEFGIKTRQEGDKVFFTFRGVTTQVEKSADAVSQYLQNIGNNAFGGAMEAQMQTFRGIMSNLEDAWDQFLVSVASHGLLDAMKEVGRGLVEMTEGSGSLSESIGLMLADTVRTLWKLFQDIQPSLVQLIVKFSDLMRASGEGGRAIEWFIGVMGGVVEASTWFIDAMGGTKNAMLALLPVVAALSVAMLGLTGLPGIIAAAIIAAMPALMELGGWMGESLAMLEEANLMAEQGVPTVRDQRLGDANVGFLVGGARESVDRVIKDLAEGDLAEVATKGTYGGGKVRVQDYAREAAQVERTMRGIKQTDDDFKTGQFNAIISANDSVRDEAIKRRLARRSRGKGKGKEKDKEKELSIEELLERDFGGGLGSVMKDDAGNTFRPTLGTTINKVTLDNHPTINLTFEMPPPLEGETANQYSERAIRQVAEGVFNEQLRIATEYFKGAGKS